jgi:hypothetical protein
MLDDSRTGLFLNLFERPRAMTLLRSVRMNGDATCVPLPPNSERRPGALGDIERSSLTPALPSNRDRGDHPLMATVCRP